MMASTQLFFFLRLYVPSNVTKVYQYDMHLCIDMTLHGFQYAHFNCAFRKQ